MTAGRVESDWNLLFQTKDLGKEVVWLAVQRLDW